MDGNLAQETGLQDMEYQNKFNEQTAEFYSQTKSFMKTIVQFLQQMDPGSQEVSSLLENLATLTGQENNDAT